MSGSFCSERYLSLRLQYALRATLSAPQGPICAACAAIRALRIRRASNRLAAEYNSPAFVAVAPCLSWSKFVVLDGNVVRRCRLYGTPVLPFSCEHHDILRGER